RALPRPLPPFPPRRSSDLRIHDAALQSRMFQRLGISDEEAKLRFGFFLEALAYGTPPHGGIALGVDRIVAILCGESSIREVIALDRKSTRLNSSHQIISYA